VDLMVGKLFRGRAPALSASILDPGCGNGEFIDGLLRACSANGWQVPRIVGVELDPPRAAAARERFRRVRQVEVRRGDFLLPANETFEYIIGNPPYVSILGFSPAERLSYRAAYRTARGRFDLYALFFEQALRLLPPEGRLVFITPEKFLYVETARPLRELLRRHHLEEFHFVGETTFGERVTYPLVSTVAATPNPGPTRVIRRDGSVSEVRIVTSTSWLPLTEGFVSAASEATITLADVASRISCGVATGADSVFVLPTTALSPALAGFAHPTVSGRQILPSHEVALRSSLLAPYDAEGRLLPEEQLGALGRFLRDPARRRQLEGRTCVERKPWYAYHDSLPLPDILRPKLLCKDITEEPFFVVDRRGDLVPRHSVYYVVPADPTHLGPLAEYLNSPEARAWLRAHCQRAANGFLRLQSHVLKQLPVPSQFYSQVAPLAIASPQAELLLA
jgi:SAM-dependent methyltransferase